jgi:hypothetical protein
MKNNSLWYYLCNPKKIYKFATFISNTIIKTFKKRDEKSVYSFATFYYPASIVVSGRQERSSNKRFNL